MSKHCTIKIIIFFFITLPAFGVPSAMEVMKSMEEQQQLETDITTKIKITSREEDEGVTVHEAIFYRRDSDDAFLIVFTAPETEKGNGYLRVGDNIWLYRRNTRTFQHINRDESIGGTDARAGDFEMRKFSELYEPATDEEGEEIISEETLGSAGIPVYRLEITAKVNDVTYPRQIVWVTRDKYLPLKSEQYSLSGTLMQTVYYRKYTEIGGKYFPVQQLSIDEFEEGNRTIVEFSGISLSPIKDSVFTKAYLENLSR